MLIILYFSAAKNITLNNAYNVFVKQKMFFNFKVKNEVP